MSIQGKILVVDDISTHLLLLRTILNDEGFDADTTDKPKTVIELLVKNNYQVLLLDIMMPGMDGFQVLEEIKSYKQLSSVNVIIISAKTDSWSIKNAMDRGAFDYITKPINVQDLKIKVQSAMIEKI
ncbi:MAG: response regulator [Bacteroidales bacterium]|jgi:DNA-binding response OmpR family regulator|nr:response regulator [Bacteroidales bacterium]